MVLILCQQLILLFNALIAAGGPTNIGSVRKIKLIRRGVETTMDVYKFINNQQ
jgi:hypothetical protein